MNLTILFTISAICFLSSCKNYNKGKLAKEESKELCYTATETISSYNWEEILNSSLHLRALEITFLAENYSNNVTSKKQKSWFKDRRTFTLDSIRETKLSAKAFKVAFSLEANAKLSLTERKALTAYKKIETNLNIDIKLISKETQSFLNNWDNHAKKIESIREINDIKQRVSKYIRKLEIMICEYKDNLKNNDIDDLLRHSPKISPENEDYNYEL